MVRRFLTLCCLSSFGIFGISNFASNAHATTFESALLSLQSNNPSLPSWTENPKGNIGFVLANLFWKSTDIGYDLSKVSKIKPQYLDMGGATVWTAISGWAFFSDPEGKVGIGTASPSASFEVKRTVADSNFAAWLEGAHDDNYGLGVNIANTWSTRNVVDFRSWNVSRFFVSGDGNVGIGVSWPLIDRLHVDGNVRLGGGIPTYRIKNLASPLDDFDAVTKEYADSLAAERFPSWSIVLFDDAEEHPGWTFLGDSYQKLQDWNISRTPITTARAGAGIAAINGKIYVFWGATGNTTFSNSVQSYDPSTNTWTAKASLPASRGHPLTSVGGDGKIYVMGGIGTTGGTTTNYQYNPVTNAFATKAALPEVASSANDVSYVDSSGGLKVIRGTQHYAYNSTTNAWSTLPGFSTAPLPGTHNSSQIIGTKLYVPYSNTSNGVIKMRIVDMLTLAVADGTSVTVPWFSGQITLMGTAKSANGIHIVGGCSYGGANGLGQQFCGSNTTGAHLIYDTESDSWSTLASMPTARWDAAIVSANGRIYAVGGHSGSAYLTSTESYDIASDSWDPRSLATAKTQHCSTSLWGKIYVIGGYAWTTNLATVEAYDPTTNTWTTKAPMPAAKRLHGCAVVDDKIYAVGGYNGSTHVATNYQYDPATDTWATKAAMPSARYALAVSNHNGYVYAMGGRTTSTHHTSTNYQYDPATDTWATKAAMPSARAYVNGDGFGGSVYLFGGSTYDATNLVWIYHNTVQEYLPDTDTWTSAHATMPIPMAYLAVRSVGDFIYIFGGYNGAAMADIYEYDPKADAFRWAGRLPTARYDIGNGAVIWQTFYAVGGFGTAQSALNQSVLIRTYNHYRRD